MVRSLLSLSAGEVVRDHCLLAERLSCIPCQLYKHLLDAAFAFCRPLAIIELVQCWPERNLSFGQQRSRQRSPNCLCESALLLAVVKGLTNKRCCLRVLDLCGLQCEDGRLEDPKYGWSLTVDLCSMLLQARNLNADLKGCRGDEGDKKTLKRDQAGLKKEEAEKKDCSDNAVCGQDNTKGMRRKIKLRRTGAEPEQDRSREGILVEVRANLFVNSRSWKQVCRALSLPGPLRLNCRFLHVVGLPASLIVSLLHLTPQEELLGLDVRYSSLMVSGLALLLSQLALFPQLCLLRLHYCNLETGSFWPSEQEESQDLSRGFGKLKSLRRLSLTGLPLTGLFPLLLSSLSNPLELLDVKLTSSDMAYLSYSPHASSLTNLDLSENRLDESSLHSLCHLLAQAEGSLKHLSLCGCGLTGGSLGALLPSLGQCHALRSLRLALNPLSRAALVQLVQAAAGIHSLKLLRYPKPLEEYQPGLPAMPTSAQLLKWPLIKDSEAIEATLTQLDEVLRTKGRSQDLFLTCY